MSSIPLHHQCICLINDGLCTSCHTELPSGMHLYLYGHEGMDKTYLNCAFNRKNWHVCITKKHPGHVDLFDFEHLFLSGSLYSSREPVDVSYPHLYILTTLLDP